MIAPILGCPGPWPALFFVFALPLLAFPLTISVVLAAGAGMRAIDRHIEDRRTDLIRRRICLKCGYDLRATPLRCPGCGTIAGLP